MTAVADSSRKLRPASAPGPDRPARARACPPSCSVPPSASSLRLARRPRAPRRAPRRARRPAGARGGEPRAPAPARRGRRAAAVAADALGRAPAPPRPPPRPPGVARPRPRVEPRRRGRGQRGPERGVPGVPRHGVEAVRAVRRHGGEPGGSLRGQVSQGRPVLAVRREETNHVRQLRGPHRHLLKASNRHTRVRVGPHRRVLLWCIRCTSTGVLSALARVAQKRPPRTKTTPSRL